MQLVENDLLAEAGNSGTQIFDSGVVTEAFVGRVLFKYTRPLDFGPKHVGLRVAVDQPVMASADQHPRDRVASGDIFEILSWNTGCFGAGLGGDRSDGSADIENKQRLVQNLVLADAVQQKHLAREDLDRFLNYQKSLVRRLAGTVDDLAGLQMI